MTTEGIVPIPKRKTQKGTFGKGRIEVPPEIEDLFGTKQREWGISEWEFLPEEFSPQRFYTFLREEDPYYTYYLLLMDYLASRSVRKPGDKRAKVEIPTEAGDFVMGFNISTEEGRKAAKNIEDEARFAMDLEQPIETLPFYEEVMSATPGKFFQREYENELTTFVEEAEEEAQELEETRKSLLDKYTPQSAEGRLKLLRGVEEGIVTPEEAYGGTKGKQKPYPWAPNTEDLDKAAFEMQQAGVSSDEIRRWMTEIAPQIKAGNIEQEMDTRSPWVKWQHAMADEQNARMFAGQKLSPENMSLLREMQQYGIPVDEGMISTLRMSDIRQEDPGLGAARYQIMESLRRAKQAELEGKSTWYSQMMPDVFAEYQKTLPVFAEGMKTGYPEQNFMNWLEQEPNKQRKLDFETKLSRDYGDVLPEYQNYLERNRFQGVKPINAWIQENPEISTYWQKRQAQRMKGLASRGSEF